MRSLLCLTIIPLKLATKTVYIHLCRKTSVTVNILNFLDTMPKLTKFQFMLLINFITKFENFKTNCTHEITKSKESCNPLKSNSNNYSSKSMSVTIATVNLDTTVIIVIAAIATLL